MSLLYLSLYSLSWVLLLYAGAAIALAAGSRKLMLLFLCSGCAVNALPILQRYSQAWPMLPMHLAPVFTPFILACLSLVRLALWPATEKSERKTWLLVFTAMLATLRYWPRMVAAAAVAAAGLAHAAYVSQAAPPGWVAVDTATVSEGYAAPASTTADDMQQFQLIEQMIQKAQDSEASVMVWPESHLGGVLRPALDFFSSEWAQLTREGKTVVAGFSTKIDGRNINAVGGYGASPFLWEQRFPAMGAMWRPWDAGHNFPMRLGAPYLQKIDGRWTTIAGWFEAGILWPLVASQLQGPQAYIAVGNLSWGRSTNLNRQGRLAVAAWARLTNLPHLVAINN